MRRQLARLCLLAPVAVAGRRPECGRFAASDRSGPAEAGAGFQRTGGGR